jgi:hypothetical protein
LQGGDEPSEVHDQAISSIAPLAPPYLGEALTGGAAE